MGLVAGVLVPDVFTPSFGALGQTAALHGHPPAVGPAGISISGKSNTVLPQTQEQFLYGYLVEGS